MPPPSISLGSSVRTLKEATRQQQADELRAAARLHRPARNLTTATARGKTESLNMARNLLFFVLGLALIVYLRMTLPPAEDAVVADDRDFGNFTRAGMADAISEGRLEVFNITGTSPHYFLLPLSGTWSVSDPSSLCTLPPLSSYYLPPPRKRFEDDVVVAGEGVMTVLKVNAMGRVQFPERVVAERERKARALAGDEL
ncbi:hypothetical protein TeGR_g2176 [Tetraparma gracilis]|uniref:Uncharacterized protein n=1 Tax=Tetraparma gracilis TaxID=2962635 RepID=A0ABQ6MU07_9STRA|nr:hypothetical protein TeGR_g2176 [Tetraparma gracilis]